MNIRTVLLASLISLTACAVDSTDMGDSTIGDYTFHIARDGDAATAGLMPRFVIKSTQGGPALA